MIRLPAHWVNNGVEAGAVVLPAIAGVDLEATVARIGDWGGDERLYSLFLGAALVEASIRDAASARSLGVIAGWRAGVVDLRDDALSRAAAGESAAVAAALGLAPEELTVFLAAQATDRFAWPGSPKAIASIGGFRGFGGSWIEVPRRAFVAGDGVLAVVTGDESWVVHADVFGHRVTRATDLPPETDARGLELQLSPDSYLVQISRGSAV